MTPVTEKEIADTLKAKGVDAPRLTPDHIESKIASEEFLYSSVGTLTLCVLTLENGFTVTGESACASPENFDEEIGKRLSRANAFNKIWALEGYLLKEKLYQESLED